MSDRPPKPTWGELECIAEYRCYSETKSPTDCQGESLDAALARAEWENAGLRMFISEVRKVLEMANMPETVKRLDAFMEEIDR